MYVFVLAAILLSIAPMHAQTVLAELSSRGVSPRLAMSVSPTAGASQRSARSASSLIPSSVARAEAADRACDRTSAAPVSRTSAGPVQIAAALHEHAPNAP